MLHVVTVCGLGVGSSLILKMTVEAALKELGIRSKIEHWDMGTVRGRGADLIVTTSGFEKNFAGQNNVIYIRNIVDKKEVKDKLSAYLDKLS